MGETLTGANLTEESQLKSKLARKDMSWKPETKSDVKRSSIKKRRPCVVFSSIGLRLRLLFFWSAQTNAFSGDKLIGFH